MINTKEDPYLFPGTQTLINKFGIRDVTKLQDLESAIYICANVASSLPKGDLEYNHLKNIHRQFFGKLYDWAGQEIDIIKGYSHFARKEFKEEKIKDGKYKLSQAIKLLKF